MNTLNQKLIKIQNNFIEYSKKYENIFFAFRENIEYDLSKIKARYTFVDVDEKIFLGYSKEIYSYCFFYFYKVLKDNIKDVNILSMLVDVIVVSIFLHSNALSSISDLTSRIQLFDNEFNYNIANKNEVASLLTYVWFKITQDSKARNYSRGAGGVNAAINSFSADIFSHWGKLLYGDYYTEETADNKPTTFTIKRLIEEKSTAFKEYKVLISSISNNIIDKNDIANIIIKISGTMSQLARLMIESMLMNLKSSKRREQSLEEIKARIETDDENEDMDDLYDVDNIENKNKFYSLDWQENNIEALGGANYTYEDYWKEFLFIINEIINHPSTRDFLNIEHIPPQKYAVYFAQYINLKNSQESGISDIRQRMEKIITGSMKLNDNELRNAIDSLSKSYNVVKFYLTYINIIMFVFEQTSTKKIFNLAEFYPKSINLPRLKNLKNAIFENEDEFNTFWNNNDLLELFNILFFQNVYDGDTSFFLLKETNKSNFIKKAIGPIRRIISAFVPKINTIENNNAIFTLFLILFIENIKFLFSKEKGKNNIASFSKELSYLNEKSYVLIEKDYRRVLYFVELLARETKGIYYNFLKKISTDQGRKKYGNLTLDNCKKLVYFIHENMDKINSRKNVIMNDFDEEFDFLKSKNLYEYRALREVFLDFLIENKLIEKTGVTINVVSREVNYDHLKTVIGKDATVLGNLVNKIKDGLYKIIKSYFPGDYGINLTNIKENVVIMLDVFIRSKSFKDELFSENLKQFIGTKYLENMPDHPVTQLQKENYSLFKQMVIELIFYIIFQCDDSNRQFLNGLVTPLIGEFESADYFIKEITNSYAFINAINPVKLKLKHNLNFENFIEDALKMKLQLAKKMKSYTIYQLAVFPLIYQSIKSKFNSYSFKLWSDNIIYELLDIEQLFFNYAYFIFKAKKTSDEPDYIMRIKGLLRKFNYFFTDRGTGAIIIKDSKD